MTPGTTSSSAARLLRTSPDCALTSTPTACVAGFQAGHNWQVKNWVGGLEIDLSASGIKGSATSVLTDGIDTEIETDTDKFKLLGSARARLGYLVWPNVLFYGTGGLGWTQLVQQIDEFIQWIPERKLKDELAFWMGGWRRRRDQIVEHQLAMAPRISALRLWRHGQQHFIRCVGRS